MPRCYRFDGSTGMDLRPAAVLEADAARIDELRRRRDPMAVTTRIRMVARSRAFLDEYGPVVWEGFDFEGGYTDRITSGSGDFLTGDTLWDFKVSGYPPNPRYTLQLLIYWRMGLHSVHPEYQSIRRLGFFNPRRNEVWLLDVDRITPELIDWTDRELIGYPA